MRAGQGPLVLVPRACKPPGPAQSLPGMLVLEEAAATPNRSEQQANNMMVLMQLQLFHGVVMR